MRFKGGQVIDTDKAIASSLPEQLFVPGTSSYRNVGFSTGFHGCRPAGIRVGTGSQRLAGAGKVYDLNSPSEFPGIYGAVQSTFAIAGGATNMSMKNQGGVTVVILKNSGQESGTQLSLGPGGMEIKMK